MKVHGGVKVWLLSFLTSALVEGVIGFTTTAALLPNEEFTIHFGRISRASLDVVLLSLPGNRSMIRRQCSP
jgi:hypothetical protein